MPESSKTLLQQGVFPQHCQSSRIAMRSQGNSQIVQKLDMIILQCEDSIESLQ